MRVATLTAVPTSAVLRLDPRWKQKWVVGRSPDDCDIVLPLTLTSRRHFEIYYTDGKYFLRDLGSTNGTFWEDTRIGPENAVVLERDIALGAGLPTSYEGPGCLILFKFVEDDDDEVMIIPNSPPKDNGDDVDCIILSPPEPQSLSEENDHEDREERSLSEENGHEGREERSLSEENGHEDREERFLSEENGHEDREERSLSEENGHEDREERSLSEENGHEDREERSLSEENCHEDREERSLREEDCHEDREERSLREEDCHEDREERSLSEEDCLEGREERSLREKDCHEDSEEESLREEDCHEGSGERFLSEEDCHEDREERFLREEDCHEDREERFLREKDCHEDREERSLREEDCHEGSEERSLREEDCHEGREERFLREKDCHEDREERSLREEDCHEHSEEEFLREEDCHEDREEQSLREEDCHEHSEEQSLREEDCHEDREEQSLREEDCHDHSEERSLREEDCHDHSEERSLREEDCHEDSEEGSGHLVIIDDESELRALNGYYEGGDERLTPNERARSQSRSPDEGTRSQTRSPDEAIRSQTRSSDEAKRSQTRSSNEATRSQTRSPDEATRSQTRSSDEATRSQTRSPDEATMSQTRSSDEAKRSQTRSSDEATRSQTRSPDEATRSQTRSSDEATRSQTGVEPVRPRSRNAPYRTVHSDNGKGLVSDNMTTAPSLKTDDIEELPVSATALNYTTVTDAPPVSDFSHYTTFTDAPPTSDISQYTTVTDAPPASDISQYTTITDAPPASDISHHTTITDASPASDISNHATITDSPPASDISHHATISDASPASDISRYTTITVAPPACDILAEPIRSSLSDDEEDVKPFVRFSLTHDVSTKAYGEWVEVLNASQRVIVISDDEDYNHDHDSSQAYTSELKRFLDEGLPEEHSDSDAEEDNMPPTCSQVLRDCGEIEEQLLTQPSPSLTETASDSIPSPCKLPTVPSPVKPLPEPLRGAIMLPPLAAPPVTRRTRKRKSTSKGEKRGKRKKQKKDEDEFHLTPRTKKSIQLKRKEKLREIARLPTPSASAGEMKKAPAPCKVKATEKSRNEMLWGWSGPQPAPRAPVAPTPSSAEEFASAQLTADIDKYNYAISPPAKRKALEIPPWKIALKIPPRKKALEIRQSEQKKSSGAVRRTVRFNDVPVINEYNIPEGNKMRPCKLAEREKRQITPYDHFQKALQLITSFNAKWIEESLHHRGGPGDLPPLLKEMKVSDVHLSFPNSYKYCQVFTPLVMLELWADMARNWKFSHHHVNTFEVFVDKVEGPNSAHMIEFQCHAVILKGCVAKDALVQISSLDQTEHLLGVVTVCTESGVYQPAEIHPALQRLVGPGRYLVRMKINTKHRHPVSHVVAYTSLYLKVIFSADKYMTMLKALGGISTSPLCSMILHPRAKMSLPPPALQPVKYRGVLDKAQRDAVMRLTAGCQGPGPMLAVVTGPAGSGKSRVLMALLVQLFRPPLSQTPRVIVCCSAPSALDVLHVKFRHWTNALGVITFSYGGPDSSVDGLADADVIFSSVIHCGADAFKAALSGSTRKLIVMVDEATQSTEVESICPLVLRTSHLILAGDVCSLEARLLSEHAVAKGMKMSLLVRVLKNCRREPERLDAVLHLTTQHRMHPQISQTLNDFLYYRSKEIIFDAERLAELRKTPFNPCMGLSMSTQPGRVLDEMGVAAGILAAASSVADLVVVVPGNDRKRLEKMQIWLDRQVRKPQNARVELVRGLQGQEVDVVVLILFASSTMELSEQLLAISRARCSTFIIFEAENPRWQLLTRALPHVVTVPASAAAANIKEIITNPSRTFAR